MTMLIVEKQVSSVMAKVVYLTGLCHPIPLHNNV